MELLLQVTNQEFKTEIHKMGRNKINKKSKRKGRNKSGKERNKERKE
jgi:hypothetical protein